MTAAAFKADPRRRAMIGKVKIAQKELGLDDTTYRAMLQRVTGLDSAAACSEAQLGQVLDEFKAKGWTPRVVAGGRENGRRTRTSPRPADHPSAKKARALWISLHQLGEVRDPSERALESFARRQLGCERLQWADQGLSYRLIEALKAMAERIGWSQDLAGVERKHQVGELKLRLANVLKRRIGEPELGPAWREPEHREQLDEVIAISAARFRQRTAEGEAET